MTRNLVLFGLLLASASCVSTKKYEALQNSQAELREQLLACDKDKNAAQARLEAMEATNSELRNQVNTLKSNNEALITNVGDLTSLTKEGAKNLERSLESLKEKDVQINTLRDAITRRDSVTLAIVTSLKGVLGNLDDEDIEINVEKGVVFIAISDKLLFNSGSYQITKQATPVLGKIAQVIKNKPDLEFMVEGHTDNVPIKNECVPDNWTLSVLRATAVAKVLQNQFGVDPKRITAAGRGEFVPLVDNNTAENRSRNRRTRIVVLPKLDQFYNLVDEGMKQAIEDSEKGR